MSTNTLGPNTEVYNLTLTVLTRNGRALTKVTLPPSIGVPHAKKDEEAAFDSLRKLYPDANIFWRRELTKGRVA